MNMTKKFVVAVGLCLMACASAVAQNGEPAWSKAESQIRDQISHLRSLPDDVRARTTKQLALDIRALPKTPRKLSLANGLANLSTEGDFGHDTLQEVATTLAEALREQPPITGNALFFYVELATLVRYEDVKVSLDNAEFTAAMAKLAADDEARAKADFTLSDLEGKSWTLRELRGKVVLVNFWATWCPPCRKEMPDLDVLYKKFKDQGLVILAIDDEEVGKIKPYLAEHPVTYPILLDPGRKANESFHVDGIPKSFVYDREGKLVAQSIDMRTQKQFLEMLAQAGLR
ncbi:MAG TPA: TlpA disulfide reductase family protein [Pyrinomonadaceae bacterium]|nr:TlpA disulfide reductase family protein [Pyrinomonadaceae bacterium]